MLEELIALDDKFQSFLLRNDYTFIGPSDPALWELFMRRTNELAPIVAITRSIHHALAHKPSTRQALDVLPPNTELRIYVITRTRHSDALVYDTIEGYCEINTIKFPPDSDTTTIS